MDDSGEEGVMDGPDTEELVAEGPGELLPAGAEVEEIEPYADATEVDIPEAELP